MEENNHNELDGVDSDEPIAWSDFEASLLGIACIPSIPQGESILASLPVISINQRGWKQERVLIGAQLHSPCSIHHLTCCFLPHQ